LPLGLTHSSLPSHLTNSQLSPLVPFGAVDSRFGPRPPQKGPVHLPKRQGSDRLDLSHLANQAVGHGATAAKNLEQILIQQQLQQQLHHHQQLAQISLIQALHAQQQFQSLQDSNARFRFPHHMASPATCPHHQQLMQHYSQQIYKTIRLLTHSTWPRCNITCSLPRKNRHLHRKFFQLHRDHLPRITHFNK
jgi:hypothetical protein